jgi:hypothetical protein
MYCLWFRSDEGSGKLKQPVDMVVERSLVALESSEVEVGKKDCESRDQ